jgi:ferredoxin--NADP+ reductase
VPYVITRLCTNDGACVEVCPVACIHTRPGAPQFYIDPDVCIDCEQCEIVCPVDAIFKDVDVPAEHAGSIDVNASFFRQNKAVVGPVTLKTAWQMVYRAHEYARSVGIAVTAAVVDEAGVPIAVGRMDGAASRTTELAISKAYTAAAFHLATADLAAQARQPWLRSLVVAHHGASCPRLAVSSSLTASRSSAPSASRAAARRTRTCCAARPPFPSWRSVRTDPGSWSGGLLPPLA